jgi:hypothetical protein
MWRTGAVRDWLSPQRDRSYNRHMASWRCPRCGAPQPETARCWVCRRSTTSCASCLNFRKAIAGNLGYCALDKHRTPLSGDEERGCWERSPTETSCAIDLVSGGVAVAAAVGGRGLWGVPARAGEPPDEPSVKHGMWTEADSIRDPERARHQYGGSIRSRPWGPVPGLRDETGWRRVIRVATTRMG